MIVLDTNIISELMRPAPNQDVRHWANDVSPSDLFTTTVTQAEILTGVALLPQGRKRDALMTAAEKVFSLIFADQILSFDSAAAEHYAVVSSERRKAGRPMQSFDAQIAAIARSCGAALATRNTRDFEGCGIDLVNPWTR